MYALAAFFSESQWRCSISYVLFSPSLFSFCLDIDGEIRCLCQNLYQQPTIIVNLVNVYKGKSLAAGLCSLRDYAFYFSARALCACVSVERVCLKNMLRVAKRSSECHRGVLVCKAGASLINVC